VLCSRSGGAIEWPVVASLALLKGTGAEAELGAGQRHRRLRQRRQCGSRLHHGARTDQCLIVRAGLRLAHHTIGELLGSLLVSVAKTSVLVADMPFRGARAAGKADNGRSRDKCEDVSLAHLPFHDFVGFRSERLIGTPIAPVRISLLRHLVRASWMHQISDE
jgi:hypothetical protein